MIKRKFFIQGIIKLPSGVVGLYVRSSLTNTYIYDFGADSIVPTTALTQALANGGATATDIFALICCASSTTVSNKYNWASTAVTIGTAFNLASSNAGVCNGNSTLGVFCIEAGSPNRTNKYTYASNVVTSGTDLNYTSSSGPGQGFGIAAYGIFPKGNNTNPGIKYTYAGDIVAATAPLVTNNRMSASFNATISIWIANTAVTNTNKYTFSSDTFVAATSILNTASKATGNDTVGVFASQAANGATNKYTYSSDTVGATTSFGITIGSSGAGVSNGTTGVNV